MGTNFVYTQVARYRRMYYTAVQTSETLVSSGTGYPGLSHRKSNAISEWRPAKCASTIETQAPKTDAGIETKKNPSTKQSLAMESPDMTARERGTASAELAR